MRKFQIKYQLAAIALAVIVATPATALGIGDLAKIVLGNSSVLKKGQEKCGQTLGLTNDDSLAMTLARAAVEKALPISQFTALDNAANTSATTAAQTPTFCNETKVQKPSMMKTIAKAGKAILKARALGGLGL